jgi:hypothetical protein
MVDRLTDRLSICRRADWRPFVVTNLTSDGIPESWRFGYFTLPQSKMIDTSAPCLPLRCQVLSEFLLLTNTHTRLSKK